jgi:hypothetical protein
MNSLIKGALLFIVAVSLAACEKTNNPVDPSSLGRTNISVSAIPQSGSFEITVPDSRISTMPATLSGSILFKFDDATSTYKYTGTYNSPEIDKLGYLEDTGTFKSKGDYINLIDDPIAESSNMHSGLFLYGDYHYSEQGNQIIIEGECNLGHIRILLNQ